MITVKKKLGTSWYTPESEKDSEQPAKFKLRELNREQLDDAMNGATILENGAIRLSPAGTRAALKAGLEDWEGITDEDGQSLKCSFVNHRYLPWAIGQELAAEILTKSMLSEEDEKNS